MNFTVDVIYRIVGPNILKYKNYEPQINESAFIAGGSHIIGKVEIGRDPSNKQTKSVKPERNSIAFVPNDL